MTTVSAPIAERARKFVSLALQRISAVGQNTIAAEIGVSPPTMSRWVSDDLERACLILAAAGLKVVDQSRICVDPHIYEAMNRIATKAMSDASIVQKLVWEE